MKLLKLAFRELFQVYYLQFKAIRKKWRIRNAINIANDEFLRTGKQQFVVPHEKFDCEVLSKTSIDSRMATLKKTGSISKSISMLDFQKECIYVTNPKIFSGNVTALGVKLKTVNQNKQ